MTGEAIVFTDDQQQLLYIACTDRNHQTPTWSQLIEQCLAQDPRPAYQQPQPERRYGACFWDLDVHWHYPEPGRIRVLDMQMAQSTA